MSHLRSVQATTNLRRYTDLVKAFAAMMFFTSQGWSLEAQKDSFPRTGFIDECLCHACKVKFFGSPHLTLFFQRYFSSNSKSYVSQHPLGFDSYCNIFAHGLSVYRFSRYIRDGLRNRTQLCNSRKCRPNRSCTFPSDEQTSIYQLNTAASKSERCPDVRFKPWWLHHKAAL